MKRHSTRNGVRARKPKRLSVQPLESRKLMAADIGFADGILSIHGTSGHDVAEVYSESDQMIVQLSSYAGDGTETDNLIESFAADEVNLVVFEGGDGDDLFVNDTSVPAVARGGAGADVLLGGSEADLLIGGSGDDLLVGGGGLDQMLVGPGANATVVSPMEDVVDDAIADGQDEDPCDPEMVDESAADSSTEDEPEATDGNAAPADEVVVGEDEVIVVDDSVESQGDVVATDDTVTVEDTVIVEEIVEEIVAETSTETVDQPVAGETDQPVADVSDEPDCDDADEPIAIAEDSNDEVAPAAESETDHDETGEELVSELIFADDAGESHTHHEHVSVEPVEESVDLPIEPVDESFEEIDWALCTPVEMTSDTAETVAEATLEIVIDTIVTPADATGEAVSEELAGLILISEPVDVAVTTEVLTSGEVAGPIDPECVEPLEVQAVTEAVVPETEVSQEAEVSDANEETAAEPESPVDVVTDIDESVETAETIGEIECVDAESNEVTVESIVADEIEDLDEGELGPPVSTDEGVDSEASSETGDTIDVMNEADESDNDILVGGSGDDWLFGGEGNDVLFGNQAALDDALLRGVIAGRFGL